MFSPLALMVFLAIAPKSETQTNNQELARRIVTKLDKMIRTGKLKRRDVTVSVKNGNVTMTGRIDELQESRFILESIPASKDIRSLHLHLGIGHVPAPTYADTPKFDSDFWSRRRPLRWEDGYWHLDFGAQPRRNTRKP